ncbi:hypothetical protein LPJ61_004846, partial [Coemansia biformis]
MARNSGGSAARRSGPAVLRRALVAVALQLAAFVALVLLIAGSLDPASTPSRLLGRTAHAASGDGAAFDVRRALADLEHIAQTPHSLNDARSIGVRDYLRAAIQAAVEGSDAEFDDPLSNGTVAEFEANGMYVYWEDSSLVVRVPGSGGASEALLVQAHYDAVPMSHGAFDDGVGVAVCLELLRSLAYRRTRHPVIVNIDWGEESGLFGARLFAGFHPWADAVRAYINLEAGGVGGRAMLFRASHSSLLRAYKQAATRPCASLVGNDAFKLGIVKSDTDYSMYTTRYGIPGLDLAFTDHRSLYHTARDNAQRATAESVLSMGAVALGTVREIADSAHILPLLPRSALLPPRALRAEGRAPHSPQLAAPGSAVDDTVFYDIMSRVMVVRSYTAELWINLLTGLLGIAAVVAIQFPFARPLPGEAPFGWTASAPAERLVMQLGSGGFFGALLHALAALAKAYASALFGSLVFTGSLMLLVAPRLAYTHLILFALLLLSAAALSATCVLSAWVARARLPDGPAMTWYALCVFRCLILLTVVVPLNWASIGVLYREQLYAWAAIAAAVLTALMDPATTLGSAWRQQLGALASRLAARGRSAGEQQERLLDHDELGSSNDGADPGPAPIHHRHDSLSIGAAQHVLSALRLLGCVLVPLAIGMDAMLRQLVVFKEHLVDGSPSLACTAIAALEITTFVMFLSPYIVGILADANGHWLIRSADAVVEPWLRFVLLPSGRGSRATSGGRAPVQSRSQISLHTNHGGDAADPDPAPSGADDDVQSRVVSYPDDTDNSDSEANEHIIILGSSGRRPSTRAAAGLSSNGGSRGGSSNGGGDNDGDDEPRRMRPAVSGTRKGEPPEMIGMRMIYAWAGVWLLLWVLVQVVMLAGEAYSSSAPLKVRAFHSTRISAECLRNAGGTCAQSQLGLSSPDSFGLAKLVESAAPRDVQAACFTQSTRDFYRCNLSRKSSPGPRPAAADADWLPESAINITDIRHASTYISGRGTLFN